MNTATLIQNPTGVRIPELAAFLKNLKRGMKEQSIAAMAADIKAAMRDRYARTEQGIILPADQHKKRALKFWNIYELVNRILRPLDPVYSGVRSGVALSTTADLFTLTTAATAQARILEFLIGGEATASAVNRVALQISTGGATPTNATPEKFNSRSPAATTLFRTGWTTQPTLSGSPLLSLAFNAFGGVIRWVAAPGEEIYLVNGEQLSCRSLSGTSTVSATVIFEEL